MVIPSATHMCQIEGGQYLRYCPESTFTRYCRQTTIKLRQLFFFFKKGSPLPTKSHVFLCANLTLPSFEPSRDLSAFFGGIQLICPFRGNSDGTPGSGYQPWVPRHPKKITGLASSHHLRSWTNPLESTSTRSWASRQLRAVFNAGFPQGRWYQGSSQNGRGSLATRTVGPSGVAWVFHERSQSLSCHLVR